MARISNPFDEDYIDLRKELLQKILETSHDFGDGIDNPIPLTRKMRSYLLGIIKWYYREARQYHYSNKLNVDKIEKILIKNYYKQDDKKFLNDLKSVVDTIKNEINDDLPF